MLQYGLYNFRAQTDKNRPVDPDRASAASYRSIYDVLLAASILRSYCITSFTTPSVVSSFRFCFVLSLSSFFFPFIFFFSLRYRGLACFVVFSAYYTLLAFALLRSVLDKLRLLGYPASESVTTRSRMKNQHGILVY